MLDHIFIKKRYFDVTRIREDEVVLQFLKQMPNNISLLEVGAGLGRFSEILRDNFRFNLTCMDVNPNLVQSLKKKGFVAFAMDIRKTDFTDEQFDIVHCSHLIEHLGYPDIVKTLDEIFRITKKNGFVIIRSPLMNPNFYLDIDHIRPYPPECILSYFNNKQQQRQGKFNVQEKLRWYRRTALEIRVLEKNKIVIFLNSLFRLMWMKYNFPKSKINGYILILQKI